MVPDSDPHLRKVKRDESVGDAAHHEAGPGTYLDGSVVLARYDGVFLLEGNTCIVRRARRALPNRRRRRGEKDPLDTVSRRDDTGGKKEGSHRHGLGKHGRLRGKKRKGRGDQGAWD